MTTTGETLILAPAASDPGLVLVDNLPLDCPTPDDARRLAAAVDRRDPSAARWADTVTDWASRAEEWWGLALQEVDAEQVRVARARGCTATVSDDVAGRMQRADWYHPAGGGPDWLDVVTAGVDGVRPMFPELPLGLELAWRQSQLASAS